MIVGNGLLASTVEQHNLDCENLIFFASGVSNSTETKESEFLREKTLLNEVLKKSAGKTLIYFSSCSLYDGTSTPYSLHKLNMEKLIQTSCEKYFIFRLPQVVGYLGNPNTVFNFLCDKVKKRENFDIWSRVQRNFIDADDVIDIVGELINHEILAGQVTNIASPYHINIEFFVHLIEEYLDVKAIYEIKDKGIKYTIDVTTMNKLIDVDKYFYSGVEKYIRSLLMKYC